MHRRSLVIRRFGPMDFGLGYFENGAWIDHTSLADGGASLGLGEGPFSAAHDLLRCCRRPINPASDVEVGRSQPIAVQRDTLAVTLVDRREHVQSVARRSSAG